jgi:hypothetical protein
LRIFLALAETVDRGGLQVRQPAFDRTGVTEFGAVEIRPDRFVVVAQGIDVAPANTIDLGTEATVVPTNREVQVANFLGVTRGEVAGKTIGELILLLDGGTWVPHQDGKVRVGLAGVTLLERDAIQGGAVEITEPFTYSNGRLSTVSSAVWDDESANMNVSSNAIAWTTDSSDQIASHNTELSTADHYAEADVGVAGGGTYAGAGVMVRHDGTVSTEDGYLIQFAWFDSGSGAQYHIEILRVDNGSSTSVGVTDLGGSPTSHNVRAEVEGTTITVFLDDSEHTSYGSASSYTTNKFVAIYAGRFGGGSPETIDNFEAGVLGGAPAPAVVLRGPIRSALRLA